MIWTLPSLFGQFFDSMVGQFVNAAGGGSRRGNGDSPWSGAPRGERDPGRIADARDGGPAFSPWSSSSEPARGSTAAQAPQDEETGPDRDLDDDMIKLVKYAIVSVRRCYERVLPGPGAADVVLVKGRMTSESFSTWIITRYLQSPEYRAALESDRRNKVRRAEERYLRVSYAVLARWPREPIGCCDNKELDALRSIESAIRGLNPPPSPEPARSSPPPSPGIRAEPARAPEASAPAPLEETSAPPVEPPPVSESAPAPETSVPAGIAASAAEPVTPSAARPRRPRSRPEAAAPASEEPAPPEEPRPGGRPPGPPRRRPR